MLQISGCVTSEVFELRHITYQLFLHQENVLVLTWPFAFPVRPDVLSLKFRRSSILTVIKSIWRNSIDSITFPAMMLLPMKQKNTGRL